MRATWRGQWCSHLVSRAVPCKAAPGGDLSISTQTQVRAIRPRVSARCARARCALPPLLGHSSSGGGWFPPMDRAAGNKPSSTHQGRRGLREPSRARIRVRVALAVARDVGFGLAWLGLAPSPLFDLCWPSCSLVCRWSITYSLISRRLSPRFTARAHASARTRRCGRLACTRTYPLR